MNKMILDKKGILEYQQNREPYLMIDYATEVIPGKSAKGYKDLKSKQKNLLKSTPIFKKPRDQLEIKLLDIFKLNLTKKIYLRIK